MIITPPASLMSCPPLNKYVHRNEIRDDKCQMLAWRGRGGAEVGSGGKY